MQKAFKTLAEIAAFEDNWDDYGSSAFPPEIVARVRKALENLDQDGPVPWVVSSPNCLSLEWSNSDKMLGVDFRV